MKKLNFIDNCIFKFSLQGETKKKKKKEREFMKTMSRSSVVLPNLVGKKMQVYNGRIYIERKITEKMVGHKLGEFSFTRQKHIFKKKAKQKKK